MHFNHLFIHITHVINITNNFEVLTAGILQGGFYHEHRPQYMNYGRLGWILGHEITHGFDDQGSQFDVNGNLFDWWKAETKEKYLAKAQCMIQQYGNYTDEEVALKVCCNFFCLQHKS